MANARIFFRPAFLCVLGLAAFFFFSCLTRSGDSDALVDLSSEAAGMTEEIFLPERFEEIAAGQSAATFKTSKPKCALYINGEYHGLTPLKAAGLIPGRYGIQIKKKGFKTVNITIQVKDGVSDFYYIEMEADDEPEKLEEPQAQDESQNPEASQAQEAAAGNPGKETVTPTQSQEAPEL